MTLKDQVLTDATLLSMELGYENREMLDALCTASTASLSARLREGLTPEDCKTEFITAASLLALAALNSVSSGLGLEQIVAGDLTLRRSSADAASRCLQTQAEMLIAPYLKDRFAFQGV